MRKHFLTLIAFTSSVVFSAYGQKTFLDPNSIDKTVKPADDFYDYANGNWIKTHTIPADEASWGNGAIIRKATRTRLQQLLSQPSKTGGSNAQKLQAFYKSAMDSTTSEKAGISPIKADLTRIAAIQNKEGIVQEAITQYNTGLSAPLFAIAGVADPIDNKFQIVTFGQGGMGLPEKSYYFNQDAKFVNIRNKYVDYLSQLLQLTGLPQEQAITKAKAILDLETRLAKSARTATENRDIAKRLNFFTVEELQGKYPAIAWNDVLKKININSPKLMVAQPEFFTTLNQELSNTPLVTWKDYLTVKLVNGASGFLSSPFEKATFDFYGTVLSGITEMKPRWERMVALTDNRMGEALGRLYVEQYFTADAKQRMNALVQNLLTTYGERIRKNDWMTDSTKQKALAKLATIRRKIGYPDKWRDYSNLHIGNNFYENAKNTAAFNFAYNISLIGKPVDRDLWDMTTPTLNAYYNSLNNEIVFPAGILLPPFFDKDADDAINYGGIATVIGHEISHGFDDRGSLFDADGKFKNWWTKTDRDNFMAKGAALANQFSQYVAVDTFHVNGQLTLGENIGDLCGVTVAYEAFKKTPQGKSNELIDGLTPDQRFFLSYATIWRSKQRDESIRSQVTVDPHSPARFRVNGPLSNLDAFYRAFNVKEGDTMFRPKNERIAIW